MDRQTHSSISSACCGNLPAILRLYIGSVTYFYQHIPIPPPGQMWHGSEGRERKICCLLSLHVFSRGHHNMSSLFPTHTDTFIHTYAEVRTCTTPLHV